MWNNRFVCIVDSISLSWHKVVKFYTVYSIAVFSLVNNMTLV